MSNQDRNRSKRVQDRHTKQVIEAKRQALIATLGKGDAAKIERLQNMTYAEIIAAKNAGRI